VFPRNERRCDLHHGIEIVVPSTCCVEEETSMRFMAWTVALCATLLLGWPAAATEDQKGEAGDKEVSAVVEENQLPPGAEVPPVQAAPPAEKTEPGESAEDTETSE
jgi:hypothetical protein